MIKNDIKSFLVDGEKVDLVQKESRFTHIPLPDGTRNVKGSLFRYHFPRDEDLEQMQQENIRFVIVACCDNFNAMDVLTSKYVERKINYELLDIPDFTVPSKESLKVALRRAKKFLKRGGNVLCHCQFGQGRTGTVLACLVSDLLGLSGSDAIEYLRLFFPAVETDEQEQFVNDWCDRSAKERAEEEEDAKAEEPLIRRNRSLLDERISDYSRESEIHSSEEEEE